MFKTFTLVTFLPTEHIFHSLNFIKMRVFFIITLFITTKGFTQYYDSTVIDSINLNRLGAEGDFYIDSNKKDYRIGVSSGRLISLGGVSKDSTNDITRGVDGGAFFANNIKAFGKVQSTGVPIKIRGATCTRINTGDYTITFNQPLSSNNYTIILSQLDRRAGNDDPGVTYYNQTINGFSVNVGDNDNGGGARADYDGEFMFLVVDF